jgi:Lhr-like helicase
MAAIRSGHDVLSSAPPGSGSSTGALLAVLTQLLSIPRWVLTGLEGGGVRGFFCLAGGGGYSFCLGGR